MRWQGSALYVAPLLFSLLPSRSSSTDLRIGFLYQQSATSWLQESWSQFKLAVQDVNADPTLLPNHNLTFVPRDSEGSERRALQGAIDLLYRASPVQAVVGTGYSSELEAPALFCSMANVPIMSPGSTAISLSDKQRYPYLLRTLSNDAVYLQAMAVTIYEMGWRKAASLSNSDYEVGATQVLHPALKALGIEYLILSYEAINTPKGEQDLDDTFALMTRAGFRVVALYAKTVDMTILDTLSRAKGLRADAYSWIMLQAAFEHPWTASTHVLAVMRNEGAASDNPVRSAFVARWPSVSTVYNQSVHGAWDPVTKMPFYGSNTYTSVIWDTDYAPVGDGEPDGWGTIVYDTVWVLAKAFHALIQAGGDPSDGASLRQRLLAVQHLGVSGEMAFDQGTQDMLAQMQVVMANGAMPLVRIGRTTNLLGTGSPGDGSWCLGGCLNVTRAQLEALPWRGGRIPSDGRALDASKSDATIGDVVMEGARIEIQFSARDSFARPPCSDTCSAQSNSSLCQACLRDIAAYDLLQLEARDLGGTLVVPAEPVPPPTVDIATGRGTLVVPRGFAGAGLYDRVLELSLRHLGELVRLSPLGPKRVTFASPACQEGMAGPAGSCVRCMPGRVAPSRGMASCAPCTAGTFQDLVGQDACKNCTAGHFAADGGRSECLSCPFGSYLSGLGGERCEPCPSPMTTLLPGSTSVFSCVCPVGFYRPLSTVVVAGQASPCQHCPPGMDCPAGSDARSFPGGQGGAPSTQFPLVQPGHWSSLAEPGSVYKCKEGPEQCPGGSPETCGPRLVDRTCAVCEAGYYRQGAGCVECPSMLLARLLFPVIPILFAFIVVIPFYIVSVGRHDETAWNASLKSAPNLAALMLANIQVAGILITCNLDNRPKSTGRGYGFVNDLLGLLQLPCGGIRSFDLQMAVKLMMPGYFSLTFILVGAVSVLLGKVNARLRMDLNILWGCLGAAFMAFYITTCAISFTLFKCYEHPNGEQSMFSAPHVLCYHGDWQQMVAVSMVAVLVYCGFSVALFIWVLWRAPSHMGDEVFMKRWRFLLSKFRPGCRWWSILWLAKGLIINLAQIIAIKGQNQILLLQIAIIIYLVAVCQYKPWRHVDVNRTDIFVHLALAIACGQLYWYAPPTGGDGGRKYLVDILFGTPLTIAVILLFSRLLVKAVSIVTNLAMPAHTVEDLDAVPKEAQRTRRSSYEGSIRVTCWVAEQVSGVHTVTNVGGKHMKVQTKLRAFCDLSPMDAQAIMEHLSEEDRRLVLKAHHLLAREVPGRRPSDASENSTSEGKGEAAKEQEEEESTSGDFQTPEEVRLTMTSAPEKIMRDISDIGKSSWAASMRPSGLTADTRNT